MKINRKELKQQAKQNFGAQYGWHVLDHIVLSILYIPLFFAYSLVTVIFVLILGPVNVGANNIYKRSSKGEKIPPKHVFSGFKTYGRNLGGGALVFLYTFLWTLLFIVPGIIKAISYNLTFYILDVDPSKGPKEALELSKKMMQGYKGQYFKLVLSFIGWEILSVLTCGVLELLYVGPYRDMTLFKFRDRVYEEYMSKNGPKKVAASALKAEEKPVEVKEEVKAEAKPAEVKPLSKPAAPKPASKPKAK